MHFLNPTESTDSLSAWSPFKCEKEKYAQRYFLTSDAGGQRKLPPTLLDRTVLDRTFRRLGGNRSTEFQEPVKLCNKNCKKTEYEVRIGKEYKKFEREFYALKCDSVRILSCVGDGQTDNGWRQIADRVQEYLGRVRHFFDCQLTYVESMESEWTLQHRTLALERLKKMYTRDVSRMDAWIELVVEA